MQAAAAGLQQEPGDGDAPAGLFVADGLGAQLRDGLGGPGVDGAGLRIAEVVAEIRADDDEGLLPAPEAGQDLRHLGRVGVPHQQRDQGEGPQGQLQEGELDLEAVLALEGGVVLA